LAARNRLPTVYPFRYFVTIGELLSYGIDQIEQSNRQRVDRILKLPVTPVLLTRADEVIE
jgi:putative tryptophan/tyrosine transport system substrate-binding protein